MIILYLLFTYMESTTKALSPPPLLEITDDITVVEYLSKMADRYVERLTEEAKQRITDFRKEATKVREEIVQYS